MKEKFKKFLEGEFRTIRPTLAAKEYREKILGELMDRAQELRIKGIDDEELIYLTCIDELGDFRDALREFDEKEVRLNNTKRKISLGAIVAFALVLTLTMTYLVVGCVAKVWHPTWLILVGGIFAGISVALGMAIVKSVKNKKYLPMRLMIAVVEVLASTFVFLVLQLAIKLDGSWMTFFAMVAMIFGVDTALAFATGCKMRFIELPIFVEMFCVMLYVILGIVTGIWHPLWLLALVGVLFGIFEAVYFIAKRTRNADKNETEKITARHKKENENYWTEWND